MFKLNAVWPNWNWREIEAWTSLLRPEVEGLFVERVIVPTRPEFPSGYLKGEWVIRLTGRLKSVPIERSLLLSVRARHPYFAVFRKKGPQAAPEATRSAFDLNLSKHLKGLRLVSVHALPRERCVLFEFEQNLRLVFSMIPATPEALLVTKTDAAVWPVIARSRTLRDSASDASLFTPPDGARAPLEMPIRPGFNEPDAPAVIDTVLSEIQNFLKKEAFALRLLETEKRLRELTRLAQDRIRQSEVAKKEAEREADWQRYGDLLKGNMGMPGEQRAGNSIAEREVLDFESGDKIKIPCDPRLDLKRQVEKFYLQSQRKSRRISEAELRIQTFSEALSRLKRNQTEFSELQKQFMESECADWDSLEKIERSLRGGVTRPALGEKTKRKGFSWLGKTFISKEGWAIWVGRSKDENLELTFKHARGNDLWMHVRGRPGAHLVIPVQPGKSVPLETLLDAATLAVHYSGGQNWGKTEVDYTFKKHVKRIKDSTEASYTHNKTLILTPDPARLKRLLGSENS